MNTVFYAILVVAVAVAGYLLGRLDESRRSIEELGKLRKSIDERYKKLLKKIRDL